MSETRGKEQAFYSHVICLGTKMCTGADHASAGFTVT